MKWIFNQEECLEPNVNISGIKSQFYAVINISLSLRANKLQTFFFEDIMYIMNNTYAIIMVEVWSQNITGLCRSISLL